MLKFVVVLGVVQGLTEFLPVSSSGHLALLQVLWRADFPGLLFDALVHVGTLLSVLWVFRRR
ncbi:MAG: undecaprenyl-diphosphate phosphatase, partial [Thermoplasmata archaeon]|nr:undecaprenyl-diphosphate phosphatase [Thermoplasmata archaeon]NIY04180.1 UDP-diphosphatase [Thermoplasmata archaeon]